ncbi:unnamed protein product [Larinioides sclopetarius]|uniref:Thyroglobulin type-1 domain-containing protein n=1 Tax=Larinioides sclopetarius TaxID=280406 RepID=A0AAV2AQQ2_9ARAC
MLQKTILLILIFVTIAEFAKAATDCEQKRENAEKRVQKGIIGVMRYKCEDDGSFQKKQCHGSTGFCHCVDPKTGERIGDYSRDSAFRCD